LFSEVKTLLLQMVDSVLNGAEPDLRFSPFYLFLI
jgi:hypothetical protein